MSEAVLAVPYACAAEIRIGPGVYREKLVCEKQDITLIGAGMESTRIVWGDGAVCRTRTAGPPTPSAAIPRFFRGIELRVRDLTIENDAGPGAKVGQAVAAYVDCSHTLFENVRLLSNQDTLFCAPLPEKEREKDGFLGPGRFAPRRPTAQYYRHCEIAGDIDFIFGGADALFEQCTIRTVNNHLPASYVTAPSGRADGLGFVFWDCDFVSDNCPAGTVFLGRPWRPTGKTAVLDCVWEPTLHRKAFRLAEPHRLGPGQLCRSGQHRRGRSSARCMGEAVGQPAGRRAAQMCTEALQTGINV